MRRGVMIYVSIWPFFTYYIRMGLLTRDCKISIKTYFPPSERRLTQVLKSIFQICYTKSIYRGGGRGENRSRLQFYSNENTLGLFLIQHFSLALKKIWLKAQSHRGPDVFAEAQLCLSSVGNVKWGVAGGDNQNQTRTTEACAGRLQILKLKILY